MKILFLAALAAIANGAIVPSEMDLARVLDQRDLRGLQGNGRSSWFTATGRYSYSLDGSLAWEYRSPYESEPIWAPDSRSQRANEAAIVQITMEIPSMLPTTPSKPLLNPIGPQFITWPVESRSPTWNAIDPRDTVQPSIPAEVPEPGAAELAIVGLCFMFLRPLKRKWRESTE